MIEGISRFEGAKHGFCIVSLCQGKLDEKDFYAFVAIEPQNYAYFKKDYQAQKGIASSFGAYGKELLRGWGGLPPEDVVHHVSRKYNVEFDVMPEFLERLIALSKEYPFPLKPAKAS